MVVAGAGDALGDQAELGKELSESHCSRCHVVDPDRPFSGISSTPSFALLVNGLEDWETRFGTFFRRLPHPSVIRLEGEPVDPEAPPAVMSITLTPDEVAAIGAWAATLKEQ